MNLPLPLLKRCYMTLLRCSEFNSPELLGSVFVTNKLGTYKSNLPESDNKKDRVAKTITYLLPARLSDNEPVFPLFILALRNRQHGRGDLCGELDQLHLAVNRVLNADTPALSTQDYDPNLIDTAAWLQQARQEAEVHSLPEPTPVQWAQPVEPSPGTQPEPEQDTSVDKIREQVIQWWDELSRQQIVIQATEWWNEQDSRIKTIAVIAPVVLLCISCMAITFGLRGWMNRSAAPEPSPTPTAAPTLAAILPPTPTATSISTPMPASTPTPTSTPTPIATLPAADPPNDIVYYDMADVSQLVQDPPAGMDIRSASVAADMRMNLEPAAQDIPAGLSGCAITDDEALLWIELYEPIIPGTRASDFYWLFVLDLDGDATTGRPSGTTAINPDLGYEAAIYLDYSNNGFSSYFLIWDEENAGFSPLISEGMRHCLGEPNTFIGIVLSTNVLNQKVEEFAKITPVLDAIKGRAAAETYIDGTQRVIDFYPNLPEQFN